MLSYVQYLAEQAWNLALQAWNTIRNYVSYLIDLIVSYANYAYSRAVAYIAGWISTILYLIDVAKTALYSIVLYYFNEAVGWINRTVAPIWQRIQEVINWVGSRIREVIDTVIGPIWQIISPIWDWFKSWWQGIVDTVRWVWNTGLNLPGQLATLWDLVKNTVIPNINKFIQDTVPTLSTVVSDPFGFVFPYLKQYLWLLLQYIIAYEFGTVKASLPPWPSFNFSGAGGAMTYQDSRQIDTSGLHSPLNSLYISGYHFGPGHYGLDLGLQNGDPVYAMHDGIVDFSGWSTVGYGYCVVVRGDKWWSRYAHCQGTLVRKDDPVHAGQPIAVGDSTGNSTGPHLHLEIKYNGQFVDPVSVLPL